MRRSRVREVRHGLALGLGPHGLGVHSPTGVDKTNSTSTLSSTTIVLDPGIGTTQRQLQQQQQQQLQQEKGLDKGFLDVQNQRGVSFDSAMVDMGSCRDLAPLFSGTTGADPEMTHGFDKVTKQEEHGKAGGSARPLATMKLEEVLGETDVPELTTPERPESLHRVLAQLG